jgi:hypothetical protein
VQQKVGFHISDDDVTDAPTPPYSVDFLVVAGGGGGGNEKMLVVEVLEVIEIHFQQKHQVVEEVETEFNI